LPETPPPYLRASVTADERAQIEAMLGPITDDDALHAVRNGRGRQFQRLEFLGDSVLDVILVVHEWAEPACPDCARREASADASDVHLAEAARNTGLGAWLEWRASAERIADLVETCVAACWLSGRWVQAARFVAQVVHPVGEVTVASLLAGAGGLEPGRMGRRAGSAILELAAADGVVHGYPDADEGELSTRRATVHRAAAVAVIARQSGVTQRGDPELVLSAVENQVAATLAAEGADAALRLAQHFVPVRTQ
jgi:dsRNA-specific ribonuclease